MTDELTPQEQEALKRLPRERMPAGLEARVTDAMREHGFLEKRRRTIAITNARLTGLLAACVALVIGAYSIGLQRGGGDPALPGVELIEKSDGGRAQDVETDLPVATDDAKEPRRKARAEVDDAREVEPAGTIDDDRSDVGESKAEKAASPSSAPPPRANEDNASGLRQVTVEEEGLAGNARNVAPTAPAESTAPRALLSESADRVQSQQKSTSDEVSTRPYTFLLNGSRVIVDAPDSVRVLQDAGDRMLLIYTSDGIIRIHLTD